MSEVNIPLLRKAVEWAEAEAAKPFELSEWYQADWVVTPSQREVMANFQRHRGAALMGAALKSPECGTCYCIAGYITHELEAIPVGSDHVGWDSIAANALGIGANAADLLFHADNSIADVRRIAESIAGESL